MVDVREKLRHIQPTKSGSWYVCSTCAAVVTPDLVQCVDNCKGNAIIKIPSGQGHIVHSVTDIRIMAHRQRLRMASSARHGSAVCASARPATSLDRIGAIATLPDHDTPVTTLSSSPSAPERDVNSLTLELARLGGLAESHTLERETKKREREAERREEILTLNPNPNLDRQD